MLGFLKNFFGAGAEEFLNRYSLAGRIGGLAFAPILALVMFLIFNSYGAYQDYRQNVQIVRLAEISKLVGNAIHETQKEKGLSAAFIGEEAKEEHKNILSAQWGITDRSVESLKTALSDDLSAYGNSFAEAAATAKESTREAKSLSIFVHLIERLLGERR